MEKPKDWRKASWGGQPATSGDKPRFGPITIDPRIFPPAPGSKASIEARRLEAERLKHEKDARACIEGAVQLKNGAGELRTPRVNPTDVNAGKPREPTSQTRPTASNPTVPLSRTQGPDRSPPPAPPPVTQPTTQSPTPLYTTDHRTLAEQLEEERLRIEIQIREEEVKLMYGLPHLYLWKNYKWAEEFLESTNKINLLVAGNQLSKSSSNIRKCILWATSPHLWPKLWARQPVQFWYMYPTGKQLRVEWETKWPKFLPRGRYKEDAFLEDDEYLPDGSKNSNRIPNPYRWELEKDNGNPYAIHFKNLGLRVYFKTYAQREEALQTATVDAIFADEEMPIDLYNEVMFRVSESSGYFHMVFTATLGQEFWRKAMEPLDWEEPNLPTAAKWHVSAYDCLHYADGTPSQWTIEKIQEIIDKCSSHEEVLKRVHGRFILSKQGKIFPNFSYKENMMPARPIPKDWLWYGAVDIGSGGGVNHPAGILFLAVSPDFKQGEIPECWRGDDVVTSNSDILEKFQEMRGSRSFLRQAYDGGAADFGMIATRAGEAFERAQKDHESGVGLLNSLFRLKALKIHDTEGGRKLAGEFSTLMKETPKNKRKDDLADPARYACKLVNWNLDALAMETKLPKLEDRPTTPEDRDVAERRAQVLNEQRRVQDEFNELNLLMGT